MNDDASPIRLVCVEVCNFRRLAKTRLDLDAATTILVGANNSGKTSLLTVLRNFLSESPGFRAFDISLSQWAKLRELGQLWEVLDEDPTTEGKETTIDRTLRLLYVTCSRAEESLALILWAKNPEAALEAINQSGWFAANEVIRLK
jgi:predicted ATP-dependent endonuclease of OLD family